MSDPIIIYSNGEQIIIDSSQLYDPFPEKEETTEEEESTDATSQDLHTV